MERYQDASSIHKVAKSVACQFGAKESRSSILVKASSKVLGLDSKC